MSATAVSRIGSNLIKTEPRGFDIEVRLEDMSTPALLPAFTLVGVKADGYGETAVSTVAYNWVGYTTAERDTSDDAADGDTVIGLRVGCVAKLVGAGLAQTDVGSAVYITDNQTITTTVGEGSAVTTIVAGASAGDVTVTGIQAEDNLVRVLHETIAGFLVDLTSEFSIASDNTINNAAGTDTSSDSLIVEYQKKSPGFVGYITEFISATSVFVFIPGRLGVGVVGN